MGKPYKICSKNYNSLFRRKSLNNSKITSYKSKTQGNNQKITIKSRYSIVDKILQMGLL